MVVFMNKKDVTFKQKVEELKKNSQASLDEQRKEKVQNIVIRKPDKKEEKQKRKNAKPFRSELKEDCAGLRKKFAIISVAFTEMELILQVCLIIPILLILLLICHQIVLHN